MRCRKMRWRVVCSPGTERSLPIIPGVLIGSSILVRSNASYLGRLYAQWKVMGASGVRFKPLEWEADVGQLRGEMLR